MTGTGTQADPLIVMSAADLYALETAGGDDKYVKLGANIDFKDTPYADDFQPIPLNCTHFDGNGKTIRNIYKSSLEEDVIAFMVSNQNGITVEDLRLENIVLRGELPSLFGAPPAGCGHIEVVRSDIALDFTSASTTIPNSSTTITDSSSVLKGDHVLNMTFTLCSVTVRGTMDMPQSIGMWVGGTSSMFYFDLKYSRSQTLNDGKIAPLIRGDCIDCGFLGDIEYTGGGTTTYYVPAWGGSHENSYSAINFKNISWVYWDAWFHSTFIWKTTGNSGVTVTNDRGVESYIKRLTLDQMKNGATLRSYGFDVVG